MSIRQLERRFGFSRDGVAKAVGTGRLVRLHRGVYAVGAAELPRHGQCLAAVLAAGPGSLLSYWSAGWLWGLVQGSPRPLHVTAPTTRRLRVRPPIRIHRARNLVDEDRRLQEDIPVTSPARTYLDLAEVMQARRLPGLLRRGEELKIFDFYEVLACCRRSRGHRGAKPLAAALASHRPATAVTRSQLERRFLALVAASGLPAPATNYAVGAYELDAYWPEAGLAVEIDAFETHGTRASFESDRRRDAELAAIGITVIRVTESRLDAEPQAVARQLAGLLTPATARLRPASRPSPA